jgi:hypothetical protein
MSVRAAGAAAALVACYELETVPLARKFSGVLDVATSCALHVLRAALRRCARECAWRPGRRKASPLDGAVGAATPAGTDAGLGVGGGDARHDRADADGWPRELLLVGGGFFLVNRAMRAHASQFVWFRRLFVTFSRYVFVNTLRRVEEDEFSSDGSKLE